MIATRLIHRDTREVPSNTYDGKGCSAEQSPIDQAQRPSRRTEHVSSGTLYYYCSSLRIKGVLEQTGDAFYINGVKINTQNAVQIQGVAPPEALCYLRQRVFLEVDRICLDL